MNAYQRLCLNESSNGISTVFEVFPLTDNQDVNSIIVSNISVYNLYDVVLSYISCGKNGRMMS